MSKELKYSREFKLDALNLLQEGKSLSDISKSLGISVNTLCTWRSRYKLYGDKELQKLENYTFSQTRLQQVADMFIFCCYSNLQQ